MKTKKRLLATLFTLAMVFSILPMGALAETVTELPVVTETTVQAPVSPQDPGAGTRAKAAIDATVSSNATWDGANQEVANAVTVSGNSTVITVTGDVTVNATITVSGGTVTFSGDRLVRGAGFTGKMLNITGGTVTLDSITLDGNKENVSATAPLVGVAAGATLNLNTQTILRNNKRTDNGANGGGLVTAGTVVMSASSISYNEATQYGGGVYVDGSGSFTMERSGIRGNTALSGGGICISPDGAGTVTINGGEMKANEVGANGSAIHGGGDGSKIILNGGTNGGTITENKSRENATTTHPGGAVYPHKSTVTVGGSVSITGNTAKAVTDHYTNTTSNLYLGKETAPTTISISSPLTKTIGVSCATATAAPCDITDINATTATLANMERFTSDFNTLRPYLKNGNQIALRTLMNDTYVRSNGSDVTGDGTSATPYATIAMAYSQVKDTGTIHVMNNIDVPETTFGTLYKSVTIEGYDNTVRTLTRSDSKMLLVNAGTITLKNIKITDPANGNSAFDGSPVCITTPGKFVMDTGSSIENTKSNYAAVYIISGEMEMKDGSSITGNTNCGTYVNDSGTIAGAGGAVTLEGHSTAANFVMSGGTITGNKAAKGGGVYTSTGTTTVKVKGNVKITGNTLSDDTTASNLQLTNTTQLTVTGDLDVDARIGVTSNVTAGGTKFGATTAGTEAYVSNIAKDAGENLIAIHKATKELVWAAADTNWLNQVADPANGYGWKDDGYNTGGVSGGGVAGDGIPNGIVIDTPAKLYSLAWAIKKSYDPQTGEATGGGISGDKYADGCYYVTRDMDMTGFTWIPIGTTRVFQGVFEGKGVRTITGINYSDNSSNVFGLFGTVSGAGIPHTNLVANLNPRYTGTAIYNLMVDGSKTTDKIWNSGTAHHMGGIAAKATDATIQNCAVKNLSLKILNTPYYTVYVGGIVGETLGTKCKLLNNSVVYTGAPVESVHAPMILTADAGSGGDNLNSHAGGIVGKATGTTISGNIVGGDNDHYVEIVADPSEGFATTSYAGGVVGYMDGGSIDNETWAHLNAMNVIANNANNTAYAGGVAGFLAGTATMTNCTPGANDGEMHFIVARRCNESFNNGKNYAGGLVGGMGGTASITNSTIGASDSQSYTVTAGVGAESVAGGLVGTMATGTSLTDCTISGNSIDSVMVQAFGNVGTAGGLVGTALDARVIKCSAQNITIAGIKASGGLAGTFTATSLAAGSDASTAPGVMAMCYARNCDVTGANHCGMIHSADKAIILACYATKGTADSGGNAFATLTDSTVTGCYTTANTAMATTATGTTFKNCYFVGTGTAAADDTVKGITKDTMQKSAGGALTQMNTALLDTYNTVTGGLRMSYMPGNSPEINGNYNYPMYAMYLLTVNSLPSSVYGTYTVKANGKTISATGATGFNQYWVDKDATVTITGTQSAYADGAITYTMTTNEAGTTTDADVTDVAMTFDKTATITFTPNLYPGWTMNTDLTNQAIYDGVVSGELGKTENKLTGNAVYSEESVVTPAWTPNDRTIKTIFVTASTATPGASNPTISAYTAYGWQVASGGVGKAYVQLTNVYGANAAAVSAIVNSFEFAANKTSTGDVVVDVQVYVDETIRGSMYYNSANGSVYELAGSPAGYSSAKLLAETSTFGAKQGHLVVIGDGAEHQFLKNTVITNAWTAAVTSNPSANAVGTWSWDLTGASDASYLQSAAAWAYPAPDNSGSHATYHYMGHFDDTNGANLALIEYDGLSTPTTGWQAYSALASGTVTCHVDVPIVTPPEPEPEPKPQPPKTDPVTGNTEVSVPVKPVTKGDTSSATVPEKAVSDAIAAAEKEAAKTGGNAGVAITVDAPKGAKTVETTLTGKSLSAVAEGKTESLKISTPVADLSFDREALKNIAGVAGKDVKISATRVDNKALTDTQKSQVGDAPVFDFTITSGGKTISNFNGGTATVSVPYTLKEGEKPEFVTVWLLSDAGKLIPIEAKYANGKITFETGHFSRYAIGYLPFTDVKADWAYESIVYAYQNRLFSGVGDDKFAPTDDMNRAMIWTVLYRMAGSPGKTETPANWYADAQNWAIAQNISDGTNPDGNVTREQLATILFRFAKAAASTADMSGFTDTNQISAFAKDGMSWAVESKILQGSTGKLNPQKTASRAEVAAMLQRFAGLRK